MAAERGGLRVAIYGAMSVLAREVRRQLEERGFPALAMHLHDVGDREGTITEYDGEATVVSPPDEDLAADLDLVLICGEDDPRCADYLDWALRGEAVALDLVGVTRGRPGVPLVHVDVNPEAVAPGARVLSAPHPLVVPLVTILHRLRASWPLAEVSATVLRPASDLGEGGVEELHRQTVGLLSFTEVPKEVFGRQIAFNAAPLPVMGEEGGVLEDLAGDDLRRALDLPGVAVSVRILQAPVFHDHAYSIHVRLGGRPAAAEVEAALEAADRIRISGEEDGRTPAELADEPGIWIGDVRSDRTGEGGYWIWAVADAMRSGAAFNAARIAERVAELAR